MSLNRFAGKCFICGHDVPTGKGDFQSVGSLPKDIRKNYTGANYKGKWLIRCFKCKGSGNYPSKE